MSRSEPRKPSVFRLDDPSVVVAPMVAPAEEVAPRPRPTRGTVLVTPAVDEPPPATEWELGPPAHRRAVGTLFWVAVAGLSMLAAGLGAAGLLEDLFARAQWLGLLGSGLATLAVLSAGVISVREAAGLLRLAAIEKLRARAEAAIASDDRQAAEAVVRGLLKLVSADPRLARSRAGVRNNLDEIIDGADLVRLAERELMGPLDAQARRTVARAARRVSIVTAVSPRAMTDMLFVLLSTLAMVRGLAYLYGGRPGTLGMIRLMRHVIAHLAVTGGMAASDSLIQQVLGHGIAARLSARSGRGCAQRAVDGQTGSGGDRGDPSAALRGAVAAGPNRPRRRPAAGPQKRGSRRVALVLFEARWA